MPPDPVTVLARKWYLHYANNPCAHVSDEPCQKCLEKSIAAAVREALEMAEKIIVGSKAISGLNGPLEYSGWNGAIDCVLKRLAALRGGTG